MGKKKTQPAAWLGCLQGVLLALGVYLSGILLLALLVVKGTVPESAAFPVTAVLCILGTAGGGMVTARQLPWGTLPSSMLISVIFAGLLAGVGALCWEGITWTGRGGILVLCILAGGVSGGFLCGRRSRHRKKRVR